MTVVGLLFGAPALAETPDDEVAGRPDVTYAALLRQIAPDLGKDANNVWTLSGIRNFHGMAASKNPLSEGVSFTTLQVLHVHEDGHKRLLVFTGDASGDAGFDTLLAAYDDETKTPRLLDYMDVGGDRFNDIGGIQPLAPGTDMVLVSSSHDNSNQSYQLDSPVFLREGKLQAVTTIFTLGNAYCTHKETQSPTFATRPEKGSKYNSIVVSVEVEVTPGDSDCDGKKPPRHSKKTVTDRYRWNDKKAVFIPASGAVERLSADNGKNL